MLVLVPDNSRRTDDGFARVVRYSNKFARATSTSATPLRFEVGDGPFRFRARAAEVRERFAAMAGVSV